MQILHANNISGLLDRVSLAEILKLMKSGGDIVMKGMKEKCQENVG